MNKNLCLQLIGSEYVPIDVSRIRLLGMEGDSRKFSILGPFEELLGIYAIAKSNSITLEILQNPEEIFQEFETYQVSTRHQRSSIVWQAADGKFSTTIGMDFPQYFNAVTKPPYYFHTKRNNFDLEQNHAVNNISTSRFRILQVSTFFEKR